MTVTFYHNPRCHTSRTALAMLRKEGVEPEIIEYLKTPFTAAQLKRILKMLDLTPRELLRKKEAKEAGLDKASLADDAIIAGMVKHPIVIERPIAVNGNKAALGRPPEKVLEVL
jgi:arsenate reductase